MSSKVFEIDDFQGGLLAGGKLDLGRHTGFESFLPTAWQRHQQSPAFRPGKSYSGIGVDKSLPMARLKARNSSVIWAQTTCRPPSLGSVSQLPLRYQPVLNRLQQGCNGSPKTFLGSLFLIGEIMDFIQSSQVESTSNKENFLRDPGYKTGRVSGNVETLYELSGWLWGNLLYLLLGGGFFFAVFSRFSPFRYLGHGLALLLGKCDEPDAPGEVSHFRALCSALSGTVGMGNVAGVAVALPQGGPGALFWMWVCALLGMATKFYTCSLAVMYRGKMKMEWSRGGPMYFISKVWAADGNPSRCSLPPARSVRLSSSFAVQQLTQIVRSMFFEPKGWFVGSGNAVLLGNGLFGLLLAFLVGLVVIGGIRRIGSVAARLVPGMILLYAAVSLLILTLYAERILPAFAVILSDAFTGRAMAGGALGMVIVTGVRRAAFSNEAGMGTEAMAHGAARTGRADSRRIGGHVGTRDRYAAHVHAHGVGSVGDRFMAIGPRGWSSSDHLRL